MLSLLHQSQSRRLPDPSARANRLAEISFVENLIFSPAVPSEDPTSSPNIHSLPTVDTQSSR